MSAWVVTAIGWSVLIVTVGWCVSMGLQAWFGRRRPVRGADGRWHAPERPTHGGRQKR